MDSLSAKPSDSNILRVALAQIAPVWLDKKRTTKKIVEWIDSAGREGANLVAFGESLLPGYPFWLSITDGSSFNSQTQKEIHRHYVRNAIEIESGDLDSICQAAKRNDIAVYLGTIEKGLNRGNHSITAHLSILIL